MEPLQFIALPFSVLKMAKRDLSGRDVGTLAERMAENYLQERGYEILQRNFRTKLGEIDLIAKKGEMLIFVEVKGKANSYEIDPEEKVNPHKQQRIIKSAQIYCLKNSKIFSKIKNIRFDVIVVNLEEGEIRHYESAFYAEALYFGR